MRADPGRLQHCGLRPPCRLVAGTTLVSHFQNVNVVTRFVYLRDGVVLLDFEPFHGDFRAISDSEFADAMRETSRRRICRVLDRAVQQDERFGSDDRFT